MKKFPKNLSDKLQARVEQNALRVLPSTRGGVDFSSNDYLGFAASASLFHQTHEYLVAHNLLQNGATGSRLLSGNHAVYATAENYIAQFHQSETTLLFNSGYDANVGFFGAVPQRNDIILFDSLCHASIRDGIQMSAARSFKFEHNNFENLEELIAKAKATQLSSSSIYIVTESVFSMDGDSPDLSNLVQIASDNDCFLVVDEAHALGVVGEKGEGLVQMLGLQDHVFARIMTFGKGLGCHGASILGSQDLKNYLVNFARSFIYTTGLSPHSVATILIAYNYLNQDVTALSQLRENIIHFNQIKNMLGVKPLFVRSKSAIQSAIIPGNDKVKMIANQLQEQGFDVKAILSPTVPEGQERLRFCLHNYNTKEQIEKVLTLLSVYVFE
ncbi:aminotransferase class I/II-fold pyridoxal phosphate-dependent enzyme [Flavobacterium sp. K77]|uniref:aminotransferase class I/II-fold pyridoxal phosphate-dependent enzyme n=1 Tax=Flavobacterium sp. K77 TaxID=2910676 RepID=UPI001F2918C4|nr:aminotransferase class I/II-fold pyridoxal phosphate-dependent enzyme [Flavobacterium sp. K77]MCF6142278.1 aminotransferase class I/II-fold pyridoxal phosphate-dependent enzyme [Flavobacterium sp. K77]